MHTTAEVSNMQQRLEVDVFGCAHPATRELGMVLDAVHTQERYRAECIGLAPTENLMSPLARSVLSSDLNHRYLFQNPLWRYVGGKYLAEIEDMAIRLTRDVYNARHANVRALSGENCIGILMDAFREDRSNLYHFATKDGGHFAAGPVWQSIGGKDWELPYDRENACLDVDACRSAFRENAPEFIYLDASLMLFPHPVRELRDAAGADAVIDYDGSQVMGLIAGKEFQDPLREGADILNGSMHKSFPGPQKAVIASDNDAFMEQIVDAIFPGRVSNFHLHHVAALAIALAETKQFGREYARQIIRNSKALAEELHAQGINVECEHLGFTESHQVWVDTTPICPPDDAMERLYDANIIVTVNMIPSVGERGLRIGTPEMTRVGMRESEMKQIAGLMADVLLERRSTRSVLADVRELRSSFQEVQYCFREVICRE